MHVEYALCIRPLIKSDGSQKQEMQFKKTETCLGHDKGTGRKSGSFLNKHLHYFAVFLEP
jgi:hypothetical protein